MRFRNRDEAGRLLAGRLMYLESTHPVVVALPRGGVPVAFPVARALDAPLEVLVVRKLGVPYQPELAMGAIGEGGVRVLDFSVLEACQVTAEELAGVEAREQIELQRRVRNFRGDSPRVDLTGRTVIVVDDGVATGSTARAACAAVRAGGAARMILAVPVGAPGTVSALQGEVDEVVCLDMPPRLGAVGQSYGDFSPVSDREVRAILDAARTRADTGSRRPGTDQEPATEDLEIEVGGVALPARLTVPAGARGLVVFAHGSGSSRHSPRNRFVARSLQRDSMATLLFDLLTEREERLRDNVFDIDTLASRLRGVTEDVRDRPGCAGLPVGFFGASTGSAAALAAAAQDGAGIAAIVSRGGRPDLAGDWLPSVLTPTLLIVGSADDYVLEFNRRAKMLLGGPSRLEIVPGATHLFEEPGALEKVATLAAAWFGEHFEPAEAAVGRGVAV